MLNDDERMHQEYDPDDGSFTASEWQGYRECHEGFNDEPDEPLYYGDENKWVYAVFYGNLTHKWHWVATHDVRYIIPMNQDSWWLAESDASRMESEIVDGEKIYDGLYYADCVSHISLFTYKLGARLVCVWRNLLHIKG